MKNPKGGRPKAEEKREVVKSYALPHEKRLLTEYADKENLTLSAYLLKKGLKKEVPIMRMSCCDRMQAWGNDGGNPNVGEVAFCVHCQKNSKIKEVF